MHLLKAKKNGPNGDKSGFLSTVRSISDIGKSFSHGRNLAKLDKEPIGPQLELPKVSWIGAVFLRFRRNFE